MSSQQPVHVRGIHAAQALRHREQLGFEPVDIWQVLERLNVPVAIRDFGSESGDGLYLWEHGEPFIVINESSRPSRQRFTAAHELGHHEMHRFEADRLVFADQDIFNSDDDREIEANAFAAYFLAPDEGMRQRLGEHTGESITQDMVVELMGVFGVSYEAMTYRLLNAQLVNHAQRSALMDNPMIEQRMRRAGIDEETNSKLPAHLPRAHINAALRLYEDHVVTPDRLAELLDMPPAEAIAFARARGVSPVAELPVDDAAVQALLRER
jgi:Zn-dependent peptidase ImmA (M78 family)